MKITYEPRNPSGTMILKDGEVVAELMGIHAGDDEVGFTLVLHDKQHIEVYSMDMFGPQHEHWATEIDVRFDKTDCTTYQSRTVIEEIDIECDRCGKKREEHG